jgi:hypothetical protein
MLRKEKAMRLRLANLLLKQVQEYIDAANQYLKAFDEAFSIGNAEQASYALRKAEECRDIARALQYEVRQLVK